MSRFLTVFGMSIQTAGAVAAAPFWQLGAAINAGGMLFYGLGAVGYGDSLRRSNDGYELLGTDDYNSATLRKGHVFTGLNFAAQGLAMFVAAIPYMVEGDPWYYFEEGTSVPMGLLAGTISLVPTLLSFIWVDMAITEALEGLRDETRAQRVSSCPRIQIAPSLIITDEQSTLGVVGVW
jgi:hypothetical protein